MDDQTPRRQSGEMAWRPSQLESVNSKAHPRAAEKRLSLWTAVQPATIYIHCAQYFLYELDELCVPSGPLYRELTFCMNWMSCVRGIMACGESRCTEEHAPSAVLFCWPDTVNIGITGIHTDTVNIGITGIHAQTP